ncbi:MAG: polysaccharide biosynthesis C-terminal domain-containing protein [candidate division KSB1 bacterium]|nr:polysaccharide biosynthesis C-terminal domain-containing protein [candidate division KSB1 bacterium]
MRCVLCRFSSCAPKSVPHRLFCSNFSMYPSIWDLISFSLSAWTSGVEAIFYANLIASGVTFLALLPIGLRRLTMNFSRSMLKELFAFGIPYLPSTMCVALMDTVDRILLERLADVEAVGVFSQGHKLGMFMALFVTAFRFAWHPFFLSTLKQENAKQIFQKVFTYVITACTVVFLFFSAFIEEIVHLRIGDITILGKEFWSATQVVPLIFLAYIFYAAYLNFLIGIYVHKKTKYLPWITFAGMSANVITNITLIPVLGMMGAAWARLAAYMVMSFTLYWVTRKLYYVRYEWGRIIKLAAVVAVFFVLMRWQPVYANTLLKAGIFLLYPAALYISGFFQRDELDLIKGVLQRKNGGDS